MKTNKDKILIQYRNGLSCPTNKSAPAPCAGEAVGLMFQAEAMRLGYLLSKELFEAICALDLAAANELYRRVIPVLWDLKGADKQWRIFYPQFPKQVLKATEQELFANAVRHYWSFGRWLPTYSPSRRMPRIEQHKLVTLELLEESELMGVFTDLLGSNMSLAESDLQTIAWFIENRASSLKHHLPAIIPFKETLCFFVSSCLAAGSNAAIGMVQSATDVLRVMTQLSGGDISLAEPVKFRSWKRCERRLLLAALEQCVREDDLARHGERWKRAFHSLHVGDYAKRFSNSYAMAQRLRSGTLQTYNSRVEVALSNGDTELLLSLLASRPGEMARRLDHLIRVLDEEAVTRLTTQFAELAARVDSRVLLQLWGHFKGRDQVRKERIVMPKGRQSKARILKKPLPALPAKRVEAVLAAIRSGLHQRFADRSSLGKVWIDPALRKCPVPLAQRSASEALRSVARGTRLPLGPHNTLRMFVWWVGQDVDLSCVLYDERFNKRGQISYTNLRMGNIDCCHSGDITYAPDGAAEFIDIDRQKAVAAGVRYLIMNVNDFTGLKFSGYKECFAGWMTREYPDSNAVFDARAVEQKVDLRTPARLAAPVLFDLQSREAIWLDLQGKVNARLPNNVESNAAKLEDLARSSLLLADKLSLHELFTAHAEARGQLVQHKADADSVFSMDEGISPFDLEKIAADFVS